MSAAAEFRRLVGPRIFGMTFRRSDGSPRAGAFRFGVARGVTGAGQAYDRDARAIVTVWDMRAGAYRNVRLDRVERLKVRGVEIERRHGRWVPVPPERCPGCGSAERRGGDDGEFLACGDCGCSLETTCSLCGAWIDVGGIELCPSCRGACEAHGRLLNDERRYPDPERRTAR